VRDASCSLASRHGAYNEKGLRTARDGSRQWRVGPLVRELAFASEEPNVRAPAMRYLIANGSAQSRKPRLQFVKQRLLGYLAVDVEMDFAVDACQRSQMRR